MQIDRLFQIVHILIEHKKVTASYLAQRFMVSTRTIYRDLDTLSLNGIPIMTTKGKEGGISLMDHYVMDKSVLTKEDKDNLKLGLETLQLTSGQGEKQALSKLRSLFNYNDEEWIKVDFSHWGNDPIEQEKFESLKEAIMAKRVVTYDYYGRSGQPVKRSVMPHQLLFKERHWYLIAYCKMRKAFRTFKISRMGPVSITEEVFIRRPLPEYKESVSGGPYIEPIHFKLKVHNNQRFRLFEEFDKTFMVKSGDYFMVDYVMPDDGTLYEYLLSFGSDLEILEPDFAREEMAKRISAIQKLY